MGDEDGRAGGGENSGNPSAGWKDTLDGQWRRIREHAETYPYVWGSYIVVYGFFGVYLTYRWRKLRRTEDRVRVLQERLRKLVEAEDAAAASSDSGKGKDLSSSTPTSVKDPTKVNEKRS
ncbi:hypothetical protein AXF42_Ash013177 [Apostasia shenzhenica]|uniref:Transmembrane protein n=1 Tax=Apostasia shenzhenica TaxID=1088818 RepID=A0A2I0BD86_9ASPA|nr:hypothetical protein AXF42_Ash013177 [Apostasia shenzhenica]